MADHGDTTKLGGNGTFSAIPLETMDMADPGKKKAPKRVLYFSDGILEEYSSDEEDEVDTVKESIVNPKTLTWGLWCLYYAVSLARRTLSAADFCGEKLAWFFGITSPKYGYAIEEYKRTQKEIEEEDDRVRKLYEEAQGLSSVDVDVVCGKKSTDDQNEQDDKGEKY